MVDSDIIAVPDHILRVCFLGLPLNFMACKISHLLSPSLPCIVLSTPLEDYCRRTLLGPSGEDEYEEKENCVLSGSGLKREKLPGK